LAARTSGAGNLSAALVLPFIGRIYDVNGPSAALRQVAFLPVMLIVVFSLIWARDKAASR